jgi:hypothetical protein
MVRVYVKGGVRAARIEVKNRGIEIVKEDEYPPEDLGIVYVDDQHLEKIIEWFGETINPPFPRGSCLLYAVLHGGW